MGQAENCGRPVSREERLSCHQSVMCFEANTLIDANGLDIVLKDIQDDVSEVLFE